MRTLIFVIVCLVVFFIAVAIDRWMEKSKARKLLEFTDSEAKKKTLEATQQARAEGQRKALEDRALRQSQGQVAEATTEAEKARIQVGASVEAGKLKDDVDAQAEIVRKTIGSGGGV